MFSARKFIKKVFLTFDLTESLWKDEIVVESFCELYSDIKFSYIFVFVNRSDREFLYEILGEVIKAGATTLNIPDTVGYTMPNEYGQLIADIKANTPGIENVIISTHCQNDLGLSTANTLAVCSFCFSYIYVCLYWRCCFGHTNVC